MGKHRNLKEEIRRQSKAKVRQIEKLLEEGRKEGKEDFL